MYTVLVVDDEHDLTWALAQSLGSDGYAVLRAHNAEQALDWLQRRQVDLAILDVLMPGVSGFELCRRLRSDERWQRIPILFLTARAELADKEQGYAGGGDDYLTKPFDLWEVKLRVAALLRRGTETPAVHLTAGDLRMDTARHTVTAGKQPVGLTSSEFDILQRLLRHPGQVVSSKQLLVEALGYAPGTGSPATVRGHVKNLRSKLDQAAGSSCLMTVGRSGYAIVPARERAAADAAYEKADNS
jgi:two-component system, OmpR family, response regulator